MFSANNLKQNPYVSLEGDYGTTWELPPIQDQSCSDWLLLAIENDEVDKIYAMRSLPFYNMIAFKIKYTFETGPQSEVIMRPELGLLKRLWDCNNPEFNKGIAYYVQVSRDAHHQYNNRKKYINNTPDVIDWYFSLLVGKYV